MCDYNIFVPISNVEKFLAEQLTCLNELSRNSNSDAFEENLRRFDLNDIWGKSAVNGKTVRRTDYAMHGMWISKDTHHLV